MRLDDWHVFATLVSSDGHGRTVAEFTLPGGGTASILERVDGRLEPPFDLEEAYRNYVSEAWTAHSVTRRLSTRQLSAYYRAKSLVPRRAQLWARRQLIRWQSRPAFPQWPVDESVDRLVKLFLACLCASDGSASRQFSWFWPGTHRAALVLGHDVEGKAGARLAIDVADLEEELGYRSAFYFGAWYPIDPGILRELVARGFEVGVHGIVHDHSLFSSRSEFDRQLPLLEALAERLGAVGFRSPATHRVFKWLAELPVEYDSTIPHSDPFEPQPGGCASFWPFFIGDVVELPYTLPQDHTLLTLLQHRSPALWLEIAKHIEERFGLIHCVSHPDPGYLGNLEKRAIYRDFLVAMAQRERVWRALPRDVAAWWRHRDLNPIPETEGRAEVEGIAIRITPPVGTERRGLSADSRPTRPEPGSAPLGPQRS